MASWAGTANVHHGRLDPLISGLLDLSAGTHQSGLSCHIKSPDGVETTPNWCMSLEVTMAMRTAALELEDHVAAGIAFEDVYAHLGVVRSSVG